MKKYLWIYACMLVALHTQAQVSMTVQLPPAGVMQKSQLWNMLLVSASSAPVNVKIMLRLSDAQTNQPLLTGISRTIILYKGAKQIRMEDANPVQYEYLSTAVDRDVNGLLATGNYQACYSIVASGHSGALLAEDCIPFTVEPVSPPLLNTPANGSVLETALPQFAWLPPAPLNIFKDLNYDMVLVEVRNGQSPAEAVQQNIPVFRAMHNRNIFVNYPSSAMALDTAKNYAWTITANNGPRYAAQTEVWTFRIKGIQNRQAANANAYMQLKKELGASVTSSSGPLYFSYSNDANDKTVQYEIIALQEGSNAIQHGKLSLAVGDNLLELGLKGSRLEDRKTYLFRLLNSRHEYWQMKFIYTRQHKQ
ncbi:hypothetical protein SAMN04488505_109110 [Chitinophaga rupis]|uniref:Oxygen tolerance n=1 Tax=Chitinophaga rupis TaxID=573321 RepID=A0A1H8F590_9BACT|nr:hypothetical protein [Chitinophaga rupis]SEN26822.1 hypothetical protein SAMN04488505_109110 [Chitinophaga rupis]